MPLEPREWDPPAELEPPDTGLSRRELLGLAWLAALGTLGIGMTRLTYRFASARDVPEHARFGDPISINPAELRAAQESAPTMFRRGRFWWVHTDAGALALYWACTRAPCVYDWKPREGRFICPCCGAMFNSDGAYFRGPAPRSLDRFVIRAFDQRGREVARTNEAGDPLEIPRFSTIVVETGRRILGAPVESAEDW